MVGTVTHANGRWTLPLTVHYADVPAGLGGSLSDRHLHVPLARQRGRCGAARVDRHASLEGVEVESDKETGDKFLRLEDVRLTELSLVSSEAQAEIAVRNPFAFPLKIAEMEYTLIVNDQEVGQGATRGLVLHAAQNNVLALPIEIDHASLLSAAGRALLSGGEIAARLHGKLVVRLKGGDLTVPLDLSGHLTGAS